MKRERERREKIEPGTGEIVEFAGAGEDDDSDFSIAKNGKFLCLFQQSIPPLRERHLSTRRIIDPPYHNLSSPHRFLLFLSLESPQILIPNRSINQSMNQSINS